VEHVVMEVFFTFFVQQHVFVVLFQIFRRRHQITAGAAGRVADNIFGGGRGQRDHHFDDVPGGAELAVLPCRGDFGKHVFVQVAFGVAVLHGDGVDHVDDLIQQRGVGDNEHRVFHETGIGAARPAIEGFDKRETPHPGTD